MNNGRKHTVDGELWLAKDLAAKYKMSGTYMRRLIRLAGGSAQKAVDDLKERRNSSTGNRVNSGNTRGPMAIGKRAWLGCSWELKIGLRTTHWNVVREVNEDGYCRARCISGPDEILGTAREFHKDDPCITTDFIPTPEQIIKARDRIKESWSDEEKSKRWVEKAGEVSIEVVRGRARAPLRRKR